jgi:hypothetical protein
MCRELIKIIEFSYLFTFSFGAIRQLKLPFAVLIRHFKPVLRGFSPQRVSNPAHAILRRTLVTPQFQAEPSAALTEWRQLVSAQI